MFSQLRHTVESFATQPHSSTDTTIDEQAGSVTSESHSVGGPLGSTSPVSSGQLAESALSNLRKSLASHRTGPPITKAASAPPAVPSEKPRQKVSLEERLRARIRSATDVTASASSSSEHAPAETSVVKESSISPSSIPLPDSPVASPRSSEAKESDAKSQTSEGENLSESVETPDAQPVNLAGTETEADVDADTTETRPVNSDANPTDSELNDKEPQEDTEVEEDLSLELDDASTNSNSQEELPRVSNPGEGVRESKESDIEALQARLKQVEQRFADVSTSFKRLQAEKLAADSVLRELTPLTSIQDATALKEYIVNMDTKTEVLQEELKRLNGKLEVQEDRIEELRETHKFSSASQEDQVGRLQKHLRETEALLAEAQKTVATLEETVSQKESEIKRLKSDAERLNTVVKEEEEKRTKAISLLKSIRQKLVKAEKDKEDALKEVVALREKNKADLETEQTERKRLEREVEVTHAEKEISLANLRAQFEKEIASLKDLHGKELAATRSQFELDAITTKSTHNKEVASKNSHISTLEASLNKVTRDKNTFFEQLQIRQAETESAQSHLESVQHQNTELQYQLREANDRITLLKDDLDELQREQELRAREPSTSVENIAHLLAATESKYEAKVAELKRVNVTLEKERNDSEAEWSRKLKDRGSEIEELKRLLGNFTRNQEKEEEAVAGLETELELKREEVSALQHQVADVTKTCSRLESAQSTAQAIASGLQAKIITLEKQIEDGKVKDTHLRQTNKSLRDELRKVQSSVALLEKQRNPGVGYWTTRTSESSNPGESGTATSATGTPRANSPAPGSPGGNSEEEVNLEYLRNVILQFLEHKEMRPNLVRVLSIILHFTPQETRRLMSKV